MILKIKNNIPNLIYWSMMILAVSLFFSISLMAGYHILIILPIIFLVNKETLKKLPASAWCLILLTLAAFLSAVVNHDILVKGYSVLTKTKYYVIAALSIVPLNFYFNEYLTGEEKDKKIKTLIHVFLFAASLATVSGLIGYFTGFNPLKFKEASTSRNSGMFSVAMDFSHQLAFLSALLAPAVLNHKKIAKWISLKWLLISLMISLTGLITTYTRGAILAFLAGLIFVNKKVAISTLLIAIVIFGVLSFNNADFIKSQIIRQQSNSERLGAWLGAIEAFKEKPAFGYGPLNYEPYSKEIKIRHNIVASYFQGHAHNNFFEILATLGVVGFIPFMAWLIFWGLEILRLEPPYLALFFPFYITFIVGGLTQMTFNAGASAFFFFFIYSLTHVFQRRGVLS